ncbi:MULTISPECIES: class I SAM-dependent methyltransferase [unclassified Xanthomonas]|uniref:class I SAM-dependent methyltransferase n=1 Tax=unclassified Xanthomonas TaxID=2643310 RepID=UPI0025D6A534|nr:MULTISPECIES: class I SAM-dependent methyltransferase [unclassified Xanthomonas]MDY4298094.1 class I SAM-dependent methyltransferase [Xanthomonas sp. LF02-5]MDY4359839.1 class I SAM-dependent methyltransferase [Xanthomonas sp. LF04-12]
MKDEPDFSPTLDAAAQAIANGGGANFRPSVACGSQRTTNDVKQMYERFPYPSPIVGNGLIRDNGNMLSVLFPDEDFAGKRILDAGCGTGQRANGVAKMFPKAQVIGVDMTSASLDAARKMAASNNVPNIEYHQCNLLELDLEMDFDVVISSGVMHHLEDPIKGLSRLRAHLSNTGVAMIWLYHALGEYERFLRRELLHRLWGENKSDLDRGASLMDALRLDLGSHQYGSVSGQCGNEISYRSINADAYMHPIVEAYRLARGLCMMLDAGYDWVAVASLNLIGKSVLIDLENSIDPIYKDISVQLSDLFEATDLQNSYLQLDRLDRLGVIELLLKPTAFTLIAGSPNATKLLPDWLLQGAFGYSSREKLQRCGSNNFSILR